MHIAMPLTISCISSNVNPAYSATSSYVNFHMCIIRFAASLFASISAFFIISSIALHILNSLSLTFYYLLKFILSHRGFH